MNHRPIHHLRRLSALFVGLSATLGTLVVSGATAAWACPGSTSVSTTSGLTSALGGCDTTIYLAQGTYTGGFVVSRSVNIVGAAESTTIVKGGSPVVDVTGGTVTIENLTITDGTGCDGGGIYNTGNLTLNDVMVSRNTSSGCNGGGIYNAGTMSIENSTISQNTSSGGFYGGGGIFNGETMTIENSTISQNTVSGGGNGGGIVNEGTLDIFQSTISQNAVSGSGDGGGISGSTHGPLYLSGVSITGNSAGFEGGGIFSYATTIIGGLISGNRAEFGGGIFLYAPTLNMIGPGGVDNNSASICGGGIYVFGGGGTLNGTTVQNNSADYGGGIDEDGPALNTSNAAVTHNHPEDIETNNC